MFLFHQVLCLSFLWLNWLHLTLGVAFFQLCRCLVAMMACQPCPPHLLTKRSKNACCPDCIPKGTVWVCDCECVILCACVLVYVLCCVSGCVCCVCLCVGVIVLCDCVVWCCYCCVILWLCAHLYHSSPPHYYCPWCVVCVAMAGVQGILAMREEDRG